jgi:cytochrome c oxidase assembly factor CtaG/ferredoxin
MNPTFDAFLRSWPSTPWITGSLLLLASVYMRGWFLLRRRAADRWQSRHLAAFMGGLTAIFLALASPVEPFASLLLQVHMAQHLLLTMIAPPFLWLGSPLIPVLRGLPEPVRTYWVAPLMRLPTIRCWFRRMAHPLSALPLFIAATWFWHVPAFYNIALQSTMWHHVQHICFLVTALLFWYPVVRPYPSRPCWSSWLLFPYLILADVQNTVLSALLTFSDRVLYTPYAKIPRIGGLSALADQSAAGVLMWVPGSLVYLLPLFVIGMRLLSAPVERRLRTQTPPAVPHALPILAANPLRQPSSRPSNRIGFDLVRLPVLGNFLKWNGARLSLQLLVGTLAGTVIYDGLWGPQVAAMNLAGVLPWIHWRGIVILGLLMAGNISCMACPLTLLNRVTRRWLPAGREWPRCLSNKWLALALLALFLWSYEAFSLWDSPRSTAWITLGYFISAFTIDGLFRGAVFCKYVCPIGQFNFVQSLLSPLEVKVRNPSVCTSCRTHECIRGTNDVPGCEMGLFQPRKLSNMDCTFCLDCVHACPHENVGILVGLSHKELWEDPVRSGIGRFWKRPDLALVIVVLLFGALANAGAMVSPVVEWQESLQSALGNKSLLLVKSFYYLLCLVLLPLLSLCVVTGLSHRWGQLHGSLLDVATRFSYSLLPLGFSVWLAHYSFHFFGSYETIVPTVQRFLGDLGCRILGEPAWSLTCCRPVGDWLPRLEVISLDVGLLISLYIAYRIALNESAGQMRAVRAFLPWGVLILALFAIGVWIILQPMQMRGTMPGV